MDLIWETAKGIGAIIGLATGAFVVWDRFYRMTPTAVVVVRPLIPGGIPKATYLQVRNRADRPILVSWQNGQREFSFGIAKDHSTRSIVASFVGGRETIVIDADAQKRLSSPPTAFRISHRSGQPDRMRSVLAVRLAENLAARPPDPDQHPQAVDDDPRSERIR